MSAYLKELARQVRESTLQRLDEARPAWLTWAPDGTSNHILWHAGHAVWLQDVLCLEPLTGKNNLPAGWAEMFGSRCRPVAETIEWPSVHEVRTRLTEQLEDIYAALDAAGLTDNDVPELGGRIIHGLHDEARHQGEMYLLLKLCQAQHVA
ncbi:MAG: DinB family protein [Pirellulales bacterium]